MYGGRPSSYLVLFFILLYRYSQFEETLQRGHGGTWSSCGERKEEGQEGDWLTRYRLVLWAEGVTS